MKRSEINGFIREAKEFFDEMRFNLPPWAYWDAKEWSKRKESAQEVFHNMLGWDLTDFGSGRFYRNGLLLFTIRNGNLKNGDPKPYAEKIMIVREEQETPMHFHWKKMEDIINRGGGNLIIQLSGSSTEEKLSDKPVEVSIDGIVRTVEPAGYVTLKPGESICLKPGVYHRFYGEAGKGMVLVGEVSAVNDDNTDNRFYVNVGRFPKIEEDEQPLHLLVNDYSQFVK
jgi:D-lyxose ketol-isomerase